MMWRRIEKYQKGMSQAIIITIQYPISLHCRISDSGLVYSSFVEDPDWHVSPCP